MNQGKKHFAPVLTLMLLAPLIAEILPGSTRFSSLFVLPIEILVWGGGAVLIRDAVRRRQLGWMNMLLLGLALSVAEEFLIQQTSLAPMVIRIKGLTYARAFGLNYVYFLWALIYESVFVVFLPVYLTEILYPNRSRAPWTGKAGRIVFFILFLTGSFLAWYSWTRIARPAVFHVPAYNPPLVHLIIGVTMIGLLVIAALCPQLVRTSQPVEGWNPPRGWTLGISGALWAVILYGIVLLAFGILPPFPPALAIITGLLLAIGAIFLVPKWSAGNRWTQIHTFSLIAGVITGSMLAGFIGFIGAAPADLYFKIIINLVAILSLFLLGKWIINTTNQYG